MDRGYNGLKTVFIAMVFISTMILLMIPQQASAGPATIVTSAIDQASQDVDVSPGSTGSVTFSGKVEATTYNPSPIVVNLQATCAGGTATVTPMSFTLTGTSTTQTLSIAVRIQPLTSFTALPVVTISGTFTQGATPGSVGTSSANVVILQYYKISIESPTPYAEISPGDQIIYSVKVWNYGNGQDTFDVKIDNEEDLVGSGWTIPPISKQVVDPLTAKAITVTAQAPQKWTIWENKVSLIKLRVTSENSNGAVKEEYSLFTRTKGLYVPGFEPTFAIIALVGLAAILKKRTLKK